MTSQEIRQQFLDFSKAKDTYRSFCSIVLKDDPLMFSNSGMTQFKDYFLGYKEPKSHRIADTQKCLRVSGKHNDLDDVGRDTYHHTMFEMLGNWSFGNYFKKEAIDWAWELLTEVYKIPKENLYVTIFEGDEKENLEEIQKLTIFGKLTFPKTELSTEIRKIISGKWANLVCGPCSEIHVDLRTPEEKAKFLDWIW
jgi:alanyl-tRNA synthetase